MEYIKNLNPATITTSPRIPGTAGITWDNSRARLMAEGWRKLMRAPQPPHDQTEIGREYIQHPELQDTAQEVLTTRPTAEIEAERIAALAHTYAGDVLLLGSLLARHGYSMPVNIAAVEADLKGKLVNGELLPEAEGGLSALKLIHGDLLAVMSNEEMVKVAELLARQ